MKPARRSLKSEIEYHIDRVTQDHIARGLDPQEARRQALLEFGGATQIEEELRDVHRARWLADLRQDLFYAARTLRRSPGFLACAVMTLALGIGANTAIFSLIDALMLRPLPAVRDAAALVQISRVTENCGSCDVSFALSEYFRNHLTSISGSFIEMPILHNATVDGSDEGLKGDEVSGRYYEVLGLSPAAGRLLGPADDAAPTPVAVISFDYWRRRFGLNPSVIGKTIVYGNTPLTIVGVEPEGFSGTQRWRTRAFAVPFSMTDVLGGGDGKWKTEWDLNFLGMMARLKPGVTLKQANAEIATAFAAWQKDKAGDLPGQFFRERFLKERALLLSGAAGMNGLQLQFRKPLAILMGIVGLVLLLACANLSGLQLARAASRQREISVRRALGAGSGRLTRQFLTESLLLAMLGGTLGIVLSLWFSRALVTMMANGEDLPLQVAADWRVLAFTSAVSLLTCVLAGLAPGLSAGKTSINPALKEVRTGGGRRGVGRALVLAQLAISMTLLVGASLFIRTLVNLYRVDAGVRTGGVFMFSLSSKHHFPDTRSTEIETAIVNRLRAMPEVVAASAASMLPLSGGRWSRSVKVDGYTFRPGEDDTVALNAIAPQYFAVTGTPVVLGREFSEKDESTSNPVAIVNQALVRELFGGKSPIGKHVTSNDVTYEIVGVVRDAKYESLRQNAPRTMYISWIQQNNIAKSNRSQPMGYWYIAKVAAGDPMRLRVAMERSVPEIDRALRIFFSQTFEDHLNRTLLDERMMATLGAFFGFLALIVACLGIFGILAFQVSRRLNEIGVRVALGATRGRILTLVLREAVTLLLPGCAAGTLAAAGLARFANSMLFGVTSTDPGAFLLAASALAAATLAAGFLPALRASRIDPMTALRCD